MKYFITYACLFSFCLSCFAPYIGYTGKSRFNLNFSIGEGLQLKETPQPIYASNYGEEDEDRLVKEADYETFTISMLDVDYAFDKNHVYYKGKIIEGIDVKTHKILATKAYFDYKSDGFVSDKNGLYYYGKKLEGVKPDDYRKIGYYIMANGIVYAKDEKTNYDLNSFEVIHNGMSDSRCDNLISYGDTLVKDKNGVYVSDINIYESRHYEFSPNQVKVDQESFKYSGNYLYEDKNNYYIVRGELRYLLDHPINKKQTTAYYRINYTSTKLEPFLLINNNNLFQLVYSYDYNTPKKYNLDLEDIEIFAVHNNIVLINFKDDIYTITEKFLMSKKELKKIYFPNPRTVVLKAKDKIVVYATSKPKIYKKIHGIDIDSLIYVESAENLNINLERHEKGVFIDKKNMYNSELKKIRMLKEDEYSALKKYKKEFEEYRLETLDGIIVKR